NHWTDRSAAGFPENYGSPILRRLAAASRSFYEAPPGGADPLVRPRGMVTIGRAEQRDHLAAELARGREIVHDLHEMAPGDVLAMVPILRPESVAGAFYEPRSRDIDVHAAHQLFLKGFRARGGTVVTDAEVGGIERIGDAWQIATPRRRIPRRDPGRRRRRLGRRRGGARRGATDRPRAEAPHRLQCRSAARRRRCRLAAR